MANGHILSGTPIAVDHWKYSPGVWLYFCSHCHSDHTKGLSPSWKEPIYCSSTTKDLLEHKFQIDKSLLIELEEGRSHELAITDSDFVSVTLIPANHCPGAVMFLFEGYFGRILYTADFRYDSSIINQPPLSLKKPIDLLYLDNTYCDLKCSFPTKKLATDDIVNAIETQLKMDPASQIFIGVKSLGKEDLLEELATHFQTWITVTPSQMEQLQILKRKNVFSVNKDDGFIHTIQKEKITGPMVRNWQKENQGGILAIIPSALYTGINGNFVSQNHEIKIIPYSDHSSYRELVNFVSFLRPKKILPIVSSSAKELFGCDISNRANMSCFDRFLDDTPPLEYSIPESIKHKRDTWKAPTLAKRQKLRKKKTQPTSFTKRKPLRGIHYTSPLKSQLSPNGQQEKSSISASKMNDQSECNVNCVDLNNSNKSKIFIEDTDVKDTTFETCDSESKVQNPVDSEEDIFSESSFDIPIVLKKSPFFSMCSAVNQSMNSTPICEIANIVGNYDLHSPRNNLILPSPRDTEKVSHKYQMSQQCQTPSWYQTPQHYQTPEQCQPSHKYQMSHQNQVPEADDHSNIIRDIDSGITSSASSPERPYNGNNNQHTNATDTNEDLHASTEAKSCDVKTNERKLKFVFKKKNSGSQQFVMLNENEQAAEEGCNKGDSVQAESSDNYSVKLKNVLRALDQKDTSNCDRNLNQSSTEPSQVHVQSHKSSITVVDASVNTDESMFKQKDSTAESDVFSKTKRYENYKIREDSSGRKYVLVPPKLRRFSVRKARSKTTKFSVLKMKRLYL